MPEPPRAWNLTSQQWQSLLRQCAQTTDALQDGAYVRYDDSSDEMHFYATPFCKPERWQYPFLEPVPLVKQNGALIGRVWRDEATGFVDFEVILLAAAQALRADYESDVSDLDYVTYEQAVEQAVRGSDNDLAWLREEFARLASLADVY